MERVGLVGDGQVDCGERMADRRESCANQQVENFSRIHERTKLNNRQKKEASGKQKCVFSQLVNRAPYEWRSPVCGSQCQALNASLLMRAM